MSADGTACILYLAWLDLSGCSTSYSGMELFTADGQRVLRRGVGSNGSGDFVDVDSPLEIGMEFPVGKLNAVYGFSSLDRSTRGFEITPDLYWKVLAPMANVALQLEGSGYSLDVTGRGYLDWVETTRITRNLGISRIRWGRVHRGEGAAVFNHIELKNHVDQKILLYADEGKALEVASHSAVLNDESKQECVVRYGAQDKMQELTLHPERQLYRGPVFDKQRIPGFMERTIVKALSGPMYHTSLCSPMQG